MLVKVIGSFSYLDVPAVSIWLLGGKISIEQAV